MGHNGHCATWFWVASVPWCWCLAGLHSVWYPLQFRKSWSRWMGKLMEKNKDRWFVSKTLECYAMPSVWQCPSSSHGECQLIPFTANGACSELKCEHSGMLIALHDGQRYFWVMLEDVLDAFDEGVIWHGMLPSLRTDHCYMGECFVCEEGDDLHDFVTLLPDQIKHCIMKPLDKAGSWVWNAWGNMMSWCSVGVQH